MKRLTLFLAVVALVQLSARAETASEERQKKALETLRKRVAYEGAHPRDSFYAPLDVNPPVQMAQADLFSGQMRVPTYSEMEKQYLNGQITQKQYERYLKEHPVDPAARKQVVNPVPGGNVGKAAPGATGPVAKPSVPTPVVAPPPSATETTNKVNEVEAKIDEIIRQKEARDKALKNAAPAPEPKTKREKLNAILKLYVDEKITDQEYKQRREKIMAEPGD